MKRLLALFLIFLIVKLALFRFNDRFDIRTIYTKLSTQNNWEMGQEIFNQEFSYLGKGSQFYAFASADGRTVLKLFRHNRTEVSEWMKRLPLPSFESELHSARMHRKEESRKRLFESCRLAFEELREESGLIALHLDETPHWNPRVKLRDRLGRRYAVELGTVSFVLQRRAERIQPVIARLMESGEAAKAQAALSSVQSLLEARFTKGIADRDPYLTKNAGLIDGKAVFIDIGSFEKVEQIDPGECVRIWRKLDLWLSERYPELIEDGAISIQTPSHLPGAQASGSS